MSDIQGVSVALYNQGEQQLHKAAQLLALTGDNLLATLPDGSQSTLNVNPLINRLEGRGFIVNDRAVILAIDIEDFALALLDDQQSALRSKSFIGTTYDEMQITWREWIKDLGVEQALSNTLGYDLSPKLQSLQAFEQLPIGFAKVWYDMRLSATQSMNELTQLVGAKSEINIWPHHFDTGVYYTFDQQVSDDLFSIGAGLAVADDLVQEPYYYIYGYSSDGGISYDKTPKLTKGTWLTDGWQGAVLPLSEMGTDNTRQINAFYKKTVEYLLTFNKHAKN